jgi:hypothetical protein
MPNNDELLALIKKQSEMIGELQHDSKKIKRRLFIMSLGSYVHLLVIVVPVILTFIYVVPFVKDNWQHVESLLTLTNFSQGGTAKPAAILPVLLEQLGAQGIDIEKVLKQLQQK